MKILLISSNTTTSPYPIYPLGVSIIAAALTNAGHEVRQFDILQHEDFLNALGQEIERFKPGLIGISIRNIDNVNLMNEQYYIETVKTIVKKIFQKIGLQQGIPIEKAREIVRLIKDAKIKVQASIQGDAVRVSGAKKDDLQAAIQLVRQSVADLPLQFINFRD